MTAETELELRIERLEEVAERWDRPDNPGGRRIARRARDKADGMRAARRLIAQARREGAAEVAERVEVSLADSLGEDPLGVRIVVRAALRGDR